MIILKRFITSLVLFVIFGVSYFLTSWNASYLTIENDWKSRLTFTPKTITNPQQIYEIDKFIYAFGVQPILTSVCLLSFICLVAFLGIHLYKFIRKNSKISLV